MIILNYVIYVQISFILSLIISKVGYWIAKGGVQKLSYFLPFCKIKNRSFFEKLTKKNTYDYFTNQINQVDLVGSTGGVQLLLATRRRRDARQDQHQHRQ